MRSTFKLLVLSVLALSIFLTACAPPPPPVTKDQLIQAEMETKNAEEESEKLLAKKNQTEKILAQKEAELRSLKEYKKQIGEN